MASANRELSHDKLRYTCDPEQFKFQTTAEVKPLSEVIGQERAVAAIDFGVNIKSFGYNIFAVGPVGAGRTSTIKEAVEKRARELPIPDDWCYVYNFQNPEEPNYLRLPAGKGKKLAKDMERFISQLTKDISEVFNSEDYKNQRQEIIQALQKNQNEILSNLDKQLRKKGFTLRKIATGLVLVPVKDGKPLTQQEIEAMPEQERKKMEETGRAFQDELNEDLQVINKLEQETKTKLDKHQRHVMWLIIEHPMRIIRDEFKKQNDVLEYLKHVEEDLLNHVEALLPLAAEENLNKPINANQKTTNLDLDRYLINLMVDNNKTVGAPVIVETNPTYHNLIGRIDRIPQMGTLVTDFTMIRAGALHKANGGFLIIEASQLFQSPITWQALKRAIKTYSIAITDLSEEYSHVSVKTLDPEPIPLDVKIIIIGNLQAYHALLSYDEEFTKLFKVKADFNMEMKLNKKNILNYARYISKQNTQKKLLHFNADAVARVIEYGVELTSNQQKLSARFTAVQDLLVEANYWAKKNHHSIVEKFDVQQALDEKKFRLNKYETRMQEMINEGTIFIDTKGKKVGQVNGLAVLDVGDYALGKPSRITARTYLGQSGVIAIDREAKMSGTLHNKGVLILSGYFNGVFGQNKQISMSASLTFEQTYDSVDGDSASSTELYALLSCLSEIPIKQGLAVTGSVNQLGEVQPIGGAKHKIEGFFDICQAQGLTGEQGVLIPKTNVRNLVLDDRVVQAVKDGKFHIYPVKTIEQGIEILTGTKAGKRLKNGKFTAGTIFNTVNEKLQLMAELRKSKKKDNENNNSERLENEKH
ncbi:AAA family ATPase [candidate division KSB1 bacterium]|nr:AAA family ATPase [candidate division KSB1 bacterium]